MVVVQRSEMNWYRALSLWVLLSSVFLLAWTRLGFRETEGSKAAILLLTFFSLGFMISSLVGLWRFRRRSRVILFKQGAETLLFANQSIEESYKFRFFRDVMGEKIVNRYRGDEPESLPVQVEGFQPVLVFLNANMQMVLRFCEMLFDDVYMNDPDHVWVHYDSASNSEPTFWDKQTPDGRQASRPVEAASGAQG